LPCVHAYRLAVLHRTRHGQRQHLPQAPAAEDAGQFSRMYSAWRLLVRAKYWRNSGCIHSKSTCEQSITVTLFRAAWRTLPSSGRGWTAPRLPVRTRSRPGAFIVPCREGRSLDVENSNARYNGMASGRLSSCRTGVVARDAFPRLHEDFAAGCLHPPPHAGRTLLNSSWSRDLSPASPGFAVAPSGRRSSPVTRDRFVARRSFPSTLNRKGRTVCGIH
jgi:hypothetical protein